MQQKYAILKLCFLALLLHTFIGTAQVGINTSTPEGILDINSDTFGVVLPRIALTASNVQAPVVNPAGGALPIGTVIYNTSTTTNGSNDIVPGIYVWTGSSWFNKFTKKQSEFYTQSTYTRPQSSAGYENIPGLTAQTFTADFTGTYKIELSVNYGGGILIDMDGDSNTTDMASQEGNFRFVFDGDTHNIETKAYSVNGSTNYYLIWEQYSIVIYKDCIRGQDYSFNLSFDQYASPEYVNGGDYDPWLGFYAQGTGYTGFDIPCSVEITYLTD